MRQKVQYDMVLLRKIFQQNQMTSIEVGEMFECCTRKASELRIELGFTVPKTLICSICGDEKAVNCFRSKFPGACIICRVKLGWEKPHQKAGPGRGKTPDMPIETVRTRCLKCWKHFLTRLDIDNKKLNQICPICTKTNKYLGEEEGYYGNVGQTSYNVLRFG